MAPYAQVLYKLMHGTPLQALLLPPFLLLLPFFILLLRLATTRSTNQAKRLPPSPPVLPVIGHLHLVGDLPHVSLCNLSRMHGHDGLMLLRLGAVQNLVVSSPRAAEAIMRTHDHLFASRPPSMIAEVLLYGSSDIAFSPYGEHWRQARRLVTTHLLTVKKVRSYRIGRQQEVKQVMVRISETTKTAASVGAVDLGEMLNTYANDVVCRAVSGKFFMVDGRNKSFRELIDANTALMGGFNLEDYFPRLSKVHVFNRFVSKKAELAHRRWDELLETIISDHEKNYLMHQDNGINEQAEIDFIDVLRSVQHDFHGITRDHIKAILIDMFAAGTDTSALVMEFAMAELMRNPQRMTKLQSEVRNGTPKGQELVEEENLTSMSYLKAVVKETLRLHPPAPLLVPHLAMADCEVEGYMIPAGTRVIINSWAIGRYPGCWEKPEEFVPERFLEGGAATAVDLRGKHFQFVPFGAGRRICPGLNFGLATVEIMLANLVYCFDWELPAGMERECIDMIEVFGLTVRRKEKLVLVPKTHVVA